MSTYIHPSSIVSSKAELGAGVRVGPFCIIGDSVEIGDGTELMSHITVRGVTSIGRRNRVFQGAAVGCEPQDKKYQGEVTRLVIGDDNVIRENCTISTGTAQDRGVTTVGSRNLFMANVHIAHDVTVGDDTIIANNCAIAGHCTVEDRAIIGGQRGVHQFVRIGRQAMVGGMSGVLRDVPPFVICSNNPCTPHGLNLVGLRRAGFTAVQISLLKKAYAALYREGNLVSESLAEIQALIDGAEEADRKPLAQFLEFVKNSPRGISR